MPCESSGGDTPWYVERPRVVHELHVFGQKFTEELAKVLVNNMSVFDVHIMLFKVAVDFYERRTRYLRT